MKRSFGEQLVTLTSVASTTAKTPEAKAEIVQELACALGRSVAMLSGGDQKLMGIWLEGAVQYAHEEAADFQKVGGLLAAMKKAAEL